MFLKKSYHRYSCQPTHSSIGYAPLPTGFDNTELIAGCVWILRFCQATDIRELVLYDNVMGDEGAKVISRALRTNTTIKALNLVSGGGHEVTADCLIFVFVFGIQQNMNLTTDHRIFA